MLKTVKIKVGNKMKSKIKKMCNVMFYLILIFLILSVTISIVGKGKSSSKFLGFRTFVILTGSMEPAIKPGDMIITRNVSTDSIKEKDIVTYQLDSNFVTHRVIEAKDGGFITKGDNNNVEDSEVVKKSQVIGVKVALIPKLGFFISFISRPFIKAILVGFLIFCIFKDIMNSKNQKIKINN